MARFSCFLPTAASRVSPMISSKRTGVSQSPIRARPAQHAAGVQNDEFRHLCSSSRFRDVGALM